MTTPNQTWAATADTWDAATYEWDKAILSSADTLGLAVLEGAVVQLEFFANDTLRVQTAESQASISFFNDYVDALGLGLIESKVLSIQIVVSDSLAIQLTEQHPPVEVQLDLVDGIPIRFIEQPAVFNTYQIYDDLRLSVVDVMPDAMAVLLDQVDDLSVQLDDLGNMAVSIISTQEELWVQLSETKIICRDDWPQEKPVMGVWTEGANVSGDPWSKAIQLSGTWTEASSLDSEEEGCST